MACAKRELLLRVHRHRLRREDLEDCYSQASLELIAHARDGGAFASARARRERARAALSLAHQRSRRGAQRAQPDAGRARARRRRSSRAGDGGVDVVDDARVGRGARARARRAARDRARRARRSRADQRLVIALAARRRKLRDASARARLVAREVPQGRAARAARLRELIEDGDASLSQSRPTPSEKTAGPTYEHTSPLIDPSHRDAGRRLNGRRHGDALPRASGRGPGISPLGLRPLAWPAPWPRRRRATRKAGTAWRAARRRRRGAREQVLATRRRALRVVAERSSSRAPARRGPQKRLARARRDAAASLAAAAALAGYRVRSLARRLPPARAANAPSPSVRRSRASVAALRVRAGGVA